MKGLTVGKLAVQRTGDVTAPLTVLYKVVGSAEPGVDFKALSGTVTIPPGASQAKLKVKPLTIDPTDGTRVVKIRLLPPADGSYLLATPAVGKIKVLDEP